LTVWLVLSQIAKNPMASATPARVNHLIDLIFFRYNLLDNFAIATKKLGKP